MSYLVTVSMHNNILYVQRAVDGVPVSETCVFSHPFDDTMKYLHKHHARFCYATPDFAVYELKKG